VKTGTLPTGNPRINRVKGFTLLELLVVLAILGIFLGIFSLGTGSILSRGDLRLATRQILSQVASVRGEAAGTRSEQSLIFNIDENRLERNIRKKKLEFGSSGDGKETVLRLPREVDLVDVRIERRGKYQEGEVAVHFFPNGCLERTLIHLKNNKDETYTIEINPLTGQATLYESYIDQEEEM
jgi:prepilin-type N-terminal cleavage/methylation domain-containing protein